MDQLRKSLSNLSTILTESLKIIANNKKLVTTITAFSFISSSILLLLFCYFIQSLLAYVTSDYVDPNLTVVICYSILVIVVEIAFILAMVAISLTSNIATIYVASTSNKDTSTRDLLAVVKATWKKQLATNTQTSRRTVPYFILVVVFTTLLQICPINIVTISVVILVGVSGFFYQLYLSVVWALASVVVVVERSVESGKEAMERSAVLVEGKRWDGFVVNLFFNLVFMVVLVVYWVLMGNEAFTNWRVFGVMMVSVGSLMRVFVIHAYVVLYFQCKKSRGEEMEPVVFENLEYSKLVTDIP